MNNPTPPAAASDSVSIPRATLKWWRDLVDINPADISPRIDAYLIAPPIAQQGGGEVTSVREQFTEWLAREMPAGTVIGDPRWWAPKIIRAFSDYRTIARAKANTAALASKAEGADALLAADANGKLCADCPPVDESDDSRCDDCQRGEVHPPAAPPAQVAGSGMGERQPTVTKAVCDGCPHLKTEYWRDHLDNDETDSGTSADCTKAGKSITAYWHKGDSPPEWCPLAAQPAPGVGGEECEVCRIFGDANLLRKSATPVNSVDAEMVVRALDALSPEAVTNRYGYRKGYRVRDVLALDDYEATEVIRTALEAAQSPTPAASGLEQLAARWKKEAASKHRAAYELRANVEATIDDFNRSYILDAEFGAMHDCATELEALAAQPAPVPRLANCGRYQATDNTGQHYYLNHANTWQPFQGTQPAPVVGGEVCVWSQQDENGDYVSTGCGQEFILNEASDYGDGKPVFPHCPYCTNATIFRRWRDEPECECNAASEVACEACADRARTAALSARPAVEGGDGLPELPTVKHGLPYTATDYYTADQMRAYAKAAVEGAQGASGGGRWDEGSPGVKPRPVGMVYPPKPTARACGYLDESGVEWCAWDVSQMEAYARAAYESGYIAGERNRIMIRAQQIADARAANRESPPPATGSGGEVS